MALKSIVDRLNFLIEAIYWTRPVTYKTTKHLLKSCEGISNGLILETGLTTNQEKNIN
jgi:hypothetical protein